MNAYVSWSKKNGGFSNRETYQAWLWYEPENQNELRKMRHDFKTGKIAKSLSSIDANKINWEQLGWIE